MNMNRDWTYVEDKLPKGRLNSFLVCLVSAKDLHGESYVTFASYQDDMGIWVDSDQEEIDVYAWRLPVPAEERRYWISL
ncbi:MAG TPA: hypothetical protein VK900_02690 [Anaerolineales bacterium]|nr:hypothetical protein [Anaerolineales bacterium]